jgi:hypothetical protein
MCGHTFCAACIFDHARLSPAREITCPTCRMPLVMAPPCVSRQLSSFIDRMRESSGPGEVCGETLEDWHQRQAAWDARQAEARAQWGVWPEQEDDEEEEWESQDQEPLVYDQTFFKLREVTPLARLKQAFCVRKGVTPDQVDFIFGGSCIEDDDTPEGLAMQEGDVIDSVWCAGPLLEQRERPDVMRARIARMETERHPTGAAHGNNYVEPAARIRPRQTRHARAERSARYMRGEGRCLNVCVESWLEDWRSSMASLAQVEREVGNGNVSTSTAAAAMPHVPSGTGALAEMANAAAHMASAVLGGSAS